MMVRTVHVAGVLLSALLVSLVGSDSAGVAAEARMTAAAGAARNYQQAMLEKDWKTICEARTELLRGGSVADCLDGTEGLGLDDYGHLRISIGSVFEVEAAGPHPAGVGLRISLHEVDMHYAVRVVPGDGSIWLIDQSFVLDTSVGAGVEDIREGLQAG
ncbi:hypothetical protein OG596_04490 [Streptomyces sp. NBC_01102]|uniref:hypothetical protein n=1 Tax=unclassified Streptomyces TaxID=2593676 RepID=UPI003864E956|nr:hypothetical protein OG596_04490 [Streptomyces sp. NBC_01102]